MSDRGTRVERPATEDSTYRIECLQCGAIAFGDPDTDVWWDKEYHRMHHCPGADFKVMGL